MRDVPPADDLPRLTWRQWWRELPGYYRIGIRTVLVVVALHLAVAVRMYFGFQEAAEMTTLRARGTPVYFWDRKVPRFRGYRWLLAGLYGRSGRSVSYYRLRSAGSDADLVSVGTHCPNLRELLLRETKATASGLQALQGCRQLKRLDLADTDLEDADLEMLTSFSQLEALSLDGTRITDRALPLLQRLPKLRHVSLSWTAVSPRAIGAWQDRGPHGLRIHTERAEYPESSLARIRWKEGRVCERFPASLKLTLRTPEGSIREIASYGLMSEVGRTFLCQMLNGGLRSCRDLPDGDYQLVLELIMSQRCHYESAPVTITFFGGQPKVSQVEFSMPVSYEEGRETCTRK